MRNVIKSIVIAGIMSFAASAFADGVAILNLNEVFQQVPQGQAAFTALQKQLAPQADKLQNQQNTLNQQLQAFQNNKANLAPAEQSAEAAQLLTQQEKVQTSISDYQSSTQKQQQALLNSFSNSMNAVVTQIAKQNGYHLVLSTQAAVYNDGTVDITSQVVQLMKKSK